MFWIIFGTASFTALVVIVTIVLMVLRNTAKSQQYARKHHFCPTCGAPQMFFVKKATGKNAIGFRSNNNE